MSGYLQFSFTGNDAIDAILSEIQDAGNAYHHTSQWSEWEDKPEDSFVARIQAAADAAAKAVPQSGWIAVTERLPEVDQKVLAFQKANDHAPQNERYDDILTDRRASKYGKAWARCNGHHHVTHWQPLPSPPAEEKP